MFDVVIKNGMVVDGTGSPWFKADVAIKGDTILEIGKLISSESKKEIDARGLTVCPGLMDVHSHSDFQLAVNGKAETKVRQGVTTEVNGNCGSSPAPMKDSMLTQRTSELDVDMSDWKWKTMAEYFRKLEKQGISMNVVQLVGHGTVRTYVMGYEDREPTKRELEEMKGLVRQSMEDGAAGISTNLAYGVPSCFARADEVVELCKVVAAYDGIYATHERSMGEGMEEAIKEAIEISERSGVPVQVSHYNPGPPLYGKIRELVKLSEDARVRGVDVTMDTLVYVYGGTSLTGLLPNWAVEGGREKTVQRLGDKETREKIKKDTMMYGQKTGGSVKRYLAQKGQWDKIWLAKVDKNRKLIGKSLAEIASLRGNKDPYDTLFDMNLEEGGVGSLIAESYSQEDLDYLMQHPLCIPESDAPASAPYGPLSAGTDNPRVYGFAPRVLGWYVRERGVLRLEEAIRKLTSFPAARFKIRRRGLLKEGMYADILIFDADKIIDMATLQNPRQYPKGIQYVLVNGKVVIEKGEHTGALPGKVLRHRAAQ